MKTEIDIVSDVVCPWCFIGKRHLELALAKLRPQLSEGLDALVRWHPFQLNPDTPEEGDAYRPFLERKFGGPERVNAIWERVRQAGNGAGIDFAFERIAIRPNTLRAHRLIHRAQQAGDAGPLVERLFVGHFQRGEDIGDVDTLVRIAGETGEDEAAVRAYLASGQDADTVLGAIAQAGEIGITGVPFFIINHQVAVSGAQPPEALAEAIRQSLAA